MTLARSHRYLLSILSGILLFISFPHTGSLFPLAFVAWIPLLLIEHEVYRCKYRPSKVFLHAYISFLIFNVGATFWIYYAKDGEVGAIMAYLLNALLMAITFQLFHFTKRYVGQKEGYISLLFYWIGFEYFHFHWELSWPWLTLGNKFAIFPEIVQWYAYSGVLGGTLWILLVNLIGFKIVNNRLFNKESWRIQTPLIYGFIALIALPSLLSLWSYSSYEETKDPIEVVITQPNIDPYNEKFSGDLKEQLNKFLSLADRVISPKTTFVLAPETAISRGFFEEDFEQTEIYSILKNRVRAWDGSALYLGASTFRFFEKHNARASRPYKDGSGYYESYNTSLLMERLNPPQFVHKSKLVLGVEKIPFSHWFPSLENLSIDLGGSSGTLGIEESPKVLQANGVTFAPVICYESVYGEFIAEQCRKGAEVIFIITNDGWWENTPGHKQHQSFARLRAIETRRCIARSANTGISSVINQRGDVLAQTKFWVPAVLKEQLQLNNQSTFYIIYGDVIGRFFGFVVFLLVIFTLVKYWKKYIQSVKNKAD